MSLCPSDSRHHETSTRCLLCVLRVETRCLERTSKQRVFLARSASSSQPAPTSTLHSQQEGRVLVSSREMLCHKTRSLFNGWHEEEKWMERKGGKSSEAVCRHPTATGIAAHEEKEQSNTPTIEETGDGSLRGQTDQRASQLRGREHTTRRRILCPSTGWFFLVGSRMVESSIRSMRNGNEHETRENWKEFRDRE